MALRHGKNLLAGDGTFDSMICHLLANLAEQVGAGDAALWHYDYGADRYELVVANSKSSQGGPRERLADGQADWVVGLYPPAYAAENWTPRSTDQEGARIYSAELLEAAGADDRAQHWRDLRGTRSLAMLPLYLGEEQIAAVTLAFKDETPPGQVDGDIALCLSSQLSVALAVARVAPPAAGDFETAHRERINENAVKGFQVTEAMANAVSALQDIDQLVPTLLRIVAHNLDIREGAYWESVRDGKMQLRYWLHGANALSPHEMAELRRDADQFPSTLVYAPEVTSGVERFRSNSEQSCPSVVEHVFGQGATALERYLHQIGCSVELHVPIFVRAIRMGALSVFRPAGQVFSEQEIELTRSLSRRIAAAQHMARIASRKRVATVARERLAIVHRASDTLRRTVDKFAEVPAMEPFLEQVLESLVETFNGYGGSLYWRDEDRVVLSLELEHGNMTRLAGTLHPNSAVLQKLLKSSGVIAERLQNGMATVVGRSDLGLAVTDRMQALSFCTLLIVPLNLGRRSFGCLSVRLTESRMLGEEEVELAKVLATQAVLAMEMTRLAEEAKDKATAEARAAELMKANDALRSTLDVVASGAETDVVLSHALRVIAGLFSSDGASAALWLADEGSETHRLRLTFESREALPLARSLAATDIFLPEQTDPLYKQHFIEGQAFAVAANELDPIQASRLRSVGVRSVVTLPMSLRGRPVGSFVVYVPCEAPEPSCDRMELAQALAHQATLVLQLTRLAEQAKVAAVASERESAALVRAAELTESNAALKRSLDVLASDADLDRFLGGLLSEIGHRVDSNRVALYFEQEAGLGCTSRLSWSDDEGVVKDAGVLLGREAADALLHTIYSLTLRRLPHVHSVDDVTGLGRKDRDALRQACVQAILHIPLVLGEQCLGCVVVLMPTSQQIPSENLELIQAFAHQATLALHLARLSAQSQSVAILQERARFAQEIHDGIVQSFIGISMQLNQMKGAEDCPARARALQLSESGLAEARRAVKALRPLQLVSKSLIEAVTDMARSVIGAAASIKVTTSGQWASMSPDTENHLFRLIQEALNNVVKHSKATEVAIEFSSSPAEASVLVSDNGIGFDVTAQDPDRGFGLFGMRQRAESIGAKLVIVSAPDQGTQVFVSLDRGPAQSSA